MNAPCVLAVDDEPEVLALISSALVAEGYHVVTAGSVAEFQVQDARRDVDIYIIDISLPDGSGFNIIKKIRQKSDRGIIVLSGRGSETDHVVGLEIGADDYVTKPFRLRELAARVNAVCRRTSSKIPISHSKGGIRALSDENSVSRELEPNLSFGIYRLNFPARRVWTLNMVEIDLTTAEFELLSVLIRKRNNVMSRGQIMNAIKGQDWEVYDRTVDGLISRLRKKLPPPEGVPHYIRTVHGIGYTFTA
ncbi:response regulator transcription factor [Paracoccus liaowanqingii]|uniref:Response regulator transcription factor n=1 Tax=Paracoccus liaowanqingii TaxID=2560053 RepID=A0A4Z1CKB1_9RHOB|nr:response regulator transcription factor [Paracoccus liaowanqingii]TGN49293.1 response regulator transcription factor [Paracoccus liaowanqingii]